MELFPAADEEQMQFIRRVIDDCDYYILIIGGRYGSLSSAGISYTELEYEYALQKGIPVLAFVHEAPDDLSVAKSDIAPELRAKLAAFRTRVCTNRLVKNWRTASELPGLVALSLQKTIKTYPAVGWVRASEATNPQLLSDLNEVRKNNDSLKARVRELETQIVPVAGNLTGMEENFTVRIRWKRYVNNADRKYVEQVVCSWGAMFAAIAPSLQEHPTDSAVQAEPRAAREQCFSCARLSRVRRRSFRGAVIAGWRTPSGASAP